tara:strand:- start:88 stop:531 length:444 start_codon:yes stop_codon:yes gene_type:complete
MNTKPFFSSKKQTWKTPKLLYKALDNEFHFTFDPCPNKADFDGLNIGWKNSNFANPPFSNQKDWIKKAYEESLKGKICVLLLPARPDTKIFHEIIFPYASQIRFIKGRLHYDEAKNSALFPSMIVVFNNNRGYDEKFVSVDRDHLSN